MKIGYLMQAGVPDVRQHPLSGPAIHVKQVFDELSKLGHQLRLLAFLDGRIWKSDDLEHFEPVILPRVDKGLFRSFERGVRRVQYELQLPYVALFESFRFAFACRQELKGFDLFYERMGWFGYGGALGARWLHVPLILEINGDHLHELEIQGMTPRPLQRRVSMALMKKTAHAAAHTVSTGAGWRRLYLMRWAVKPDQITVVENGTDLVRLLGRNQLRVFDSNSNRDAVTTIAYSGGFDPWQGVTLLVRAVAHVIQQGIPVRLVLIGTGGERADIEKLVNEQGLKHHVTFTGRLGPADYAEYLAQADIGVAPYCGREEFSGLKLLDYKAAGLATIASGGNGEPAVITHGKTGWILPPCDESALRDAIAALCSDSELRKQMGRQARIEAEQFHSWTHTAERLDELFVRVKREHDASKNRANNPNALEPA